MIALTILLAIALIIVSVGFIKSAFYWRDRETELVDTLEIVEEKLDDLQDEYDSLVKQRDLNAKLSTLNNNAWAKKYDKLHTAYELVVNSSRELMDELRRSYDNLEMVINQQDPIPMEESDEQDYYKRTRHRYSARRPVHGRPRSVHTQQHSYRIDAILYGVYSAGAVVRNDYGLTRVGGDGV